MITIAGLLSANRIQTSKLVVIFSLIICGLGPNLFAQTIGNTNYLTQNYSQNYISKSSAFTQEIAKMEINVVRGGKAPISVTKVPLLEKGDVLKVRMLDEMVNGAKPDQSNWDWTFLVAYINPGRNNDRNEAVSNEIQFRKTGWYREYSFTVPYDSQPMFFLYPKPNYRDKILKLVSKKYDEVRKIGDKTIDIAGAYAQIGMFLNELQFVLNQYNYGYGGFRNNYYGGYGNDTGFNYKLFTEQSVERLARSFNINLPGCWQNGFGSYNSYGSYGNYNSGGYNSYGSNNSYGSGYYGGMNNDLVGRLQCVAKNVRLEDFDYSVTRMLQQGGILAVQQLQQKYPQIAQWIGIAAVALDFIIRLTKKTPLKVVPTIISTSENHGGFYGGQNGYYANNFAPSSQSNATQADSTKISIYAENQPSTGSFVTAYPIVLHKWEAETNAEVISLRAPALMESCLHTGQNILRNTDLLGDWTIDPYSRDFKLVISAPNGFRKEFPLKKNLGMNGWEMNLTKEDINSFPKIQMALESEVVGRRGFNEIRSPKFNVPIPIGGSWEITGDSKKNFAAGGRRVVTLRNELGNCRCLQTVVYKPSFGGEFVFDANGKENALLYSEDGKEVSFEIDTRYFEPGTGQLELRQAGGEATNLNINLHPEPATVTELRIARGDRSATIIGERLEQVKYVLINGKKAVAEGGTLFQNSARIGNSYAVTERTVVFEEMNAGQKYPITLELGLDEGRIVKVEKQFNFSPARPNVVANQAREVEGIAIETKTKRQAIFSTLPILPIDATSITVNLQNALTDHDFKAENISVETRIENTQVNSGDLPKANVEVLDWKTLKITFAIDPKIQQFIGGKRLQFRLRDKARGDSDWFTVNKTFVRTPMLKSLNCTAKDKCMLKGTGLEYISEISSDGGVTWQQQTAMDIKQSADGMQEITVPAANINTIKFRLRDLPKTEGVTFRSLTSEVATPRP